MGTWTKRGCIIHRSPSHRRSVDFHIFAGTKEVTYSAKMPWITSQTRNANCCCAVCTAPQDSRSETPRQPREKARHGRKLRNSSRTTVRCTWSRLHVFPVLFRAKSVTSIHNERGAACMAGDENETSDSATDRVGIYANQAKV